VKTTTRRVPILTAHFLSFLAAASAATAAMPTFLARHDYPGLNGSFVQVADTNGDGIPDLLVCELVRIWIHSGSVRQWQRHFSAWPLQLYRCS
jgi:hypothetical protein